MVIFILFNVSIKAAAPDGTGSAEELQAAPEAAQSRRTESPKLPEPVDPSKSGLSNLCRFPLGSFPRSTVPILMLLLLDELLEAPVVFIWLIL